MAISIFQFAISDPTGSNSLVIAGIIGGITTVIGTLAAAFVKFFGSKKDRDGSLSGVIKEYKGLHDECKEENRILREDIKSLSDKVKTLVNRIEYLEKEQVMAQGMIQDLMRCSSEFPSSIEDTSSHSKDDSNIKHSKTNGSESSSSLSRKEYLEYLSSHS